MKVPIINYHAIGANGSPLWTPAEVFEQHLNALADSGWETLTLGDLISSIRNGRKLKERSCVLTFDHGYENVYTDVFPRLRRFGFTATVFLVTAYCGKNNQWPGQSESMPIGNLLNWNQISELSEFGLEFGAQSNTHASLTALSPDKVFEELVTSRNAIEHHTGKAARIFAYPYGESNSSVVKFVRRFFTGAVGTNLGFVDDTSSLYQLPRIDAYYINPRWIPQLQRKRFREYLRLRQAMRSIRRFVYPDNQSISGQIYRDRGKILQCAPTASCEE